MYSLPVVSEQPRIKVKGYQGQLEVAAEALIDSGSVCSTIHPALVEEFGINTQKLPHQRIIQNADGTVNTSGPIRREVKMAISTGIAPRKLHTFAVVNTGRNEMILGLDFLKRYNPIIDWVAKTIKSRKWP